jgi:hypothetical protein
VIKLGVFLLFFWNTSKVQGLSPNWVQLPLELYMKNKYKNIKIAKQIFSTQKVDQDMWTNSICNPNKIHAKPTCNIETKTNNTTLTTAEGVVHSLLTNINANVAIQAPKQSS